MVSGGKSIIAFCEDAEDKKLERTEGQNRTGNKKEPLNFICRICGSKEFKEEYKNNGIYGPGSRSFRIYYFCSGCSVVFIDPEKFSLK